MEIIGNSTLNLLNEHKYIFSFIAALLEGNFIMLLGGALLRFGYFNFFGLGAVLVGGYFLNGVFWYVVGRIAGHAIVEKWIKRFRIGKKIADKLENYFQDHSIRTIFITRVTYGISMFSFLIAGSLKMNLKKFFTVSLAATIVWVLVVGGIGYGFGAGFQTLSKIAKGITIGVTAILFVLIILISLSFVYWMRYFARTKFVKELENHESPILSKIGEIIRKAFHQQN